MKEIVPEIINQLYKERKGGVRKYDNGTVLVIGGSENYTGSPVLSAMAAMRAGADIAKVAAPWRAADVAAMSGPDMITFPFPGDHLSCKHLGKLVTLTKGAEEVSRGKLAVVLGGGMGREEGSKALVREYIKKVNVPVVVDADGIYAFEGKAPEVEESKILFTPHLYEFFILTGVNVNVLSPEEKAQAVKRAADRLSSTILLKGESDIVSSGSEVEVNKMSVPQMAIGGTGDVLAGIAGTLLARGFLPFDAAKGAAVINTLAGDLAVKEKGESIIAVDVIDKLHKVIN